MTQLDAMAGAAMRTQVLYSMAWGRMESVLPKSRINGAWNRKPNTQMQPPASSDKKKLVEANTRALSTSCPPSLRLMLLPAPCPNINPNALMIAISANTTPVAPLTLVPSWLTKKVSAML